MKIYLTGDTHGDLDTGKFSLFITNLFKEGTKLTKDDYMIVLGDFGVLWAANTDDREKKLLEFYKNVPWTTLFVCGNHENIPRLNQLPTVPMFGSEVGKISDDVYHLRRGMVYTIGNRTFLTFGGATSTDKHMRIESISWWPEENCSHSDIERALTNLDKCGNKVDYILAHTLPKTVIQSAYKYSYQKCPTAEALEYICSTTKFSHYFCGHFHEDRHYSNYHILYDSIIDLGRYFPCRT